MISQPLVRTSQRLAMAIHSPPKLHKYDQKAIVQSKTTILLLSSRLRPGRLYLVGGKTASFHAVGGAQAGELVTSWRSRRIPDSKMVVHSMDSIVVSLCSCMRSSVSATRVGHLQPARITDTIIRLLIIPRRVMPLCAGDGLRAARGWDYVANTSGDSVRH